MQGIHRLFFGGRRAGRVTPTRLPPRNKHCFRSLPAVVRFVRGVHHKVRRRRLIGGAAVLIGHVVDQHVQVDELLRPVHHWILLRWLLIGVWRLLVVMVGVADCGRRGGFASPLIWFGRHQRDRPGDRARPAHVHGRGLRARRVPEPRHGVLPHLPVILRKFDGKNRVNEILGEMLFRENYAEYNLRER